MSEERPDEGFAARFNEALAETTLPNAQMPLGKKLGVSGITARNWKNGVKLPSMEKAIHICGPKLLNVCVEWLVTGRGPKRPSRSVDALKKYPREILNLVLAMSPEYQLQVRMFAEESLRRHRDDIDAALKETTEKKEDGETDLSAEDKAGEGELPAEEPC